MEQGGGMKGNFGKKTENLNIEQSLRFFNATICYKC